MDKIRILRKDLMKILMWRPRNMAIYGCALISVFASELHHWTVVLENEGMYTIAKFFKPLYTLSYLLRTQLRILLLGDPDVLVILVIGDGDVLAILVMGDFGDCNLLRSMRNMPRQSHFSPP